MKVKNAEICFSFVFLTLGSIPGSIHETAIDVPPPYQTKTVGESSSGKSSIEGTDGVVSGMMKFATRQPKATLNPVSTTSRDSNVPSKFVNPGYERDMDDEFGSVECLDEPLEEKPKSFSMHFFLS